MNLIDLIIIAGVLIFVYRDYRKGFTGVIFSLLAIIIALYGAFKLYPLFSEIIQKIIESKELSTVISFVLIFIVLNFTVNRLGEYFAKLLEKLYLNWLNGLLGGVIGLIKGFLLIGVILTLIGVLNYPALSKPMKESRVSPYIISLFNKTFYHIAGAIPFDMKEKVIEYYKKFSDVKK